MRILKLAKGNRYAGPVRIGRIVGKPVQYVEDVLFAHIPETVRGPVKMSQRVRDQVQDLLRAHPSLPAKVIADAVDRNVGYIERAMASHQMREKAMRG